MAVRCSPLPLSCPFGPVALTLVRIVGRIASVGHCSTMPPARHFGATTSVGLGFPVAERWRRRRGRNDKHTKHNAYKCYKS
eukprot:9313906-Pyramimonas_sp.AAC.1